MQMYFAHGGERPMPDQLFLDSSWMPLLGCHPKHTSQSPFPSIPPSSSWHFNLLLSLVTMTHPPPPPPPPNLSHLRLAAFYCLHSDDNLLVFPADKSLVIKHTQYIHCAFSDHFSDTTTYQLLSGNDALAAIHVARALISHFFSNHSSANLLPRPLLPSPLHPGQCPFGLF